VVRSIRCRTGKPSKAGDVLIELDPTVNAAERDHLRNDLSAERSTPRVARRTRRDDTASFTPPADADPVLIAGSVSCLRIR